jgi:hypothetical protein
MLKPVDRIAFAWALALGWIVGCGSSGEPGGKENSGAEGGRIGASAGMAGNAGMVAGGGSASGGVGTGGAANSEGGGRSGGSSLGGGGGNVGTTGGTGAINGGNAVTTGGGPTTNGGGGATGGRVEGGGGNAGSGGSNSGSAGTGTGGGTGVGGASGDPPSPRSLDVTADKARHQHTFRAKDADPAVSFNDNTQVAVLDNRAATLMGKLVLPFGGLGTNAGTLDAGGEFCARRGFHVLGIAAFQDYDILSAGADFFGNARRQVFEGKEYTREGAFANISMTPADGVAQRTQKALQYLHAQFPEEDWGYYLQSDGSVRWSDVIFAGFSHGGSNAARFATLVRASRVVSLSAPRENLCVRSDPANCGGVVATWLGETPVTPRDRFFALSGRTDEQHLQHLFAMEKLGYAGSPTSIDGAAAPYGGSHRLTTDAGHTDFCKETRFASACNYMFGVPSENQAGTSP